MPPPPSSPAEVDQFVERGHVRLAGAFPRAVAGLVRPEIARRLGCDFDDPATWAKPWDRLDQVFRAPPFTDAVTGRVEAAFDQLLGTGRWKPLDYMGWWPVSFPGFPDPPQSAYWHMDGSFRHHPWSPEQALLPIFLFSDVEPAGGATLLAEGSHHAAAKILWQAEPAGLDEDSFSGPVIDAADLTALGQAAGQAGDVVLCHGLLLHSASPNHAQTPRIMANPRVDLTAPKRAAGPDLSPVEMVIARARPHRAGRCL